MTSNQEMMPLDQIATFEMGQSPDSSFVNDKGEGVPFLQGCAEFGPLFPKHIYYCVKPTKICQPNDILISVRAPVGDVNKADRTYCIGRGLAAVRFLEALPEFGWHLLNYWARNLHTVAQGSTFQAISKADLETLQVICPPLPEQRHIAEILDTADETIRQTERLIAKLKQMKQGLLHDLLTRGLDARGHLRDPLAHPEQFKDSPLGRIPREWEVQKLQELYKTPLRDFGSFSMTNLITFLDSGVPFLKSEMIEEGRINTENLTYISEEVHKLLYKSWVYPGNVLYSKIGSALGKAVVYDGSLGICNSNAAIAKIDVDERLMLPHYLAHVLNSAEAKQRILKRVISLLPRINLTDISNFLIARPPIWEQEMIIEVLDAHDARFRAEETYRDKLKLQKQGLMHDLLTGRVRV